MFIINVIPISRGIGKESLSYFSTTPVELGSFISVPLRNRQIPGLVLECKPATDMKAELRNSDFAMRKIGKVKAKKIFRKEYVETAHQLSDYYAGSTGSVLANISPKIILDNAEDLEEFSSQDEAPSTAQNEIHERHEPYSLQADEEERLAHYKSLIREQFARKKSVIFCLPTIQDTKRIVELLPKGIEDYTFVLNSSRSKKDLISTWNTILKTDHPVLVITTGSFMSVPRQDIGTIIIDRENANGYKSQTRPYVDIRTFAEVYAKKIGARLIFGDLLMRIETLWRTNNAELNELAPLKFRSLSTTETEIIDMKKYKTLDTPEFRIISDELEALVQKNHDNNENLYIFTSRRGLSPLTVCGDCGTTVLCNRCSSPMTLHQGKETFFLCHRCGERRSAEERCRNCDSWKLTTLGIGIELIEEALRNMFPDMMIFRMDKDTITTHKQALNTINQFYNAPGSVLLGTEMALTYIDKPIDNAAVASIDSLFSIPDFRISEKIMNNLLRIRSITQKKFLIQTRSKEQHIFSYAAKGNLMDFYREEIEGRKRLSYPPFSTLIKLTVKGTRQVTSKEMASVENDLAEFNPLVFPAFIETVDRKSILHALIRIEHGKWVEKNLLQKLQALPPHIAINIDPESLL